MANFKADSVSSLTLPGVGVKVVVIGLIELRAVNPGMAARNLTNAAATWDCVITEIGAGAVLNPANQMLGVAVPARLATNRSVSGVTFTLPKAVAMEW